MRSSVVVVALVIWLGPAARGAAQEPPPRIPFFVVDLHGVVPMFPSDSAQLAASRMLQSASQLPGAGLGGDIGVHIYPLKWRATTFGVGGTIMTARAHQAVAGGTSTTLQPVTERYRSIAPQLSFNFGSGAGWSYLSGGMATSTWSIVPEGSTELPSDQQRLKTINYGGGARWFVKPHLAFSFDVRFYAINPSAPNGALPSSPRTTLVVIGAGVSLK